MTLTLILTRHAKSSWNHPGLRDHDRPLNKRGRASATALGNWLRDRNLIPDEILCSTATRTRETVERMALDTAVTFDPSLYHASAGDMLGALRAAHGTLVMMVGHNPGIADFAERLVRNPPAHERFFDYPTGATTVITFPLARWQDVAYGTGTPRDFVIPRELPE